MGTRKNRLAEAVLTSTHNLCFEQKHEKYQNFYLQVVIFSVAKFAIYLNRRVFVMQSIAPVNRAYSRFFFFFFCFCFFFPLHKTSCG